MKRSGLFVLWVVVASPVIAADQGALSIERLEISNVKNIISHSTGKKTSAVANIGQAIGNKGKVVVNTKRVGKVTNRVDRAHNSTATLNMDYVDARINGGRIRTNAKNVLNKVAGGTNNHANLNFGSISGGQKATHIAGKTVIESTINGDMENIIRGGSGNGSELSIGSISGN